MQAESREAIAAALLETAEKGREAQAKWQAAADEAMAAAGEAWREKLAEANAELDKVHKAAGEEQSALIAQIAKGEEALLELRTRAEAEMREAAAQHADLCAVLAETEEALTAAIPMLQHGAAEGAVTRAQEGMASAEIFRMKEHELELEERMARFAEDRLAAHIRADEQTRLLVECQIELRDTKAKNIEASLLVHNEEQLDTVRFAERRAAAEREELAVRAAEQRVRVEMDAYNRESEESLRSLHDNERSRLEGEWDNERKRMEREWKAERAQWALKNEELEAARKDAVQSEAVALKAMDTEHKEALRVAEAEHKLSEERLREQAKISEQRLRENLQKAHATDLDATINEERELRTALELKHASELGSVARRADAAVAAARTEAEEQRKAAEDVKREWTETGATQEMAMESTESECRRLFAALKTAEARATEAEASATESTTRATQLQAQLDAAAGEGDARKAEQP